MSFYFFSYNRNLRRTIHRGDCRFCKQGSVFQRSVDSGSKGYWAGPFLNYQQTLTEALNTGKFDETLIDCRHCHPAQSVNISNSLVPEYDINGVLGQEPVYKESITNNEIQELLQRHRKELLAFHSLSNHFQELIRRRHRMETLSMLASSTSRKLRDALARQHFIENDELYQAQSQSLHDILQRQAQELDAFRS